MEKKVLLKSLLISILFSLSISLSGQTQHVPEYLHAHFDKTFYVAGEDMWYTIYFLNPTDRQSEIVHVELIAPNGSYIMQQTLKVTDDRTHGDFALPPSLGWGYYQFRAYTNWDLNFTPQEIYSEYIGVFPAKLSTEKPETDNNIEITPNNSQSLISLNQPSFLPRENIEISLASGMGNGSVSIIDLNFVKESDRNKIINRRKEVEQKPLIPIPGGEPQIEPEKKYTRTFMLRQPGTEDYVSSNFISGFVQQTHQKLMRPAKGGIVTLDFDDFYDSTVVQFFDANPFKATYIPLVSLINDDSPVDPPEPSTVKPPLTPEVYRFIKDYQKRFQINDLFGSRNTMRAEKPVVIPSTIQPTNSYEVDKFIAFNKMTEFIKHTVPPVKIKLPRSKSGEKPTFKLYVPHKEVLRGIKIIEKPPLLLVNDYFTYDTEAVLKLPWTNVLQVDVFNTAKELPYQFGPIGDFGVIAFKTKDGVTPRNITETENNLKIEGFYLPRKYEMPEYDKPKDSNSRIPNLRPVIYWNPKISLLNPEDCKISFPAGDQPGKYLIQFEGVMKDGTPIYAEEVLEIKLNR